MARQARIEFPGAFYHVMARGNRREPIFVDPDGADQELFLQTLGDACERSDMLVWAWVLMGNHYHLVIETPKGNLVEGMSWLQNAYTRRFNARHKLWGRLFGDRYKSVLVEDQDRAAGGGSGGSSYLATLLDYVHLNPYRARLIEPGAGLGLMAYPWSSLARGYGLTPKRRPQWLQVRAGLELFGFTDDSAANRRKFVQRLDERALEEQADRCGLVEIEGQVLNSTLQRGWYWGSETFKERLMAHLDRRQDSESGLPGSSPYRGDGQLADYQARQAERIVEAGAAHFGLESAGRKVFEGLARQDIRRVAVAWMLWKRTSMPQKWIAERLGLRSAANVSQRVRAFDARPERELDGQVKAWKKGVKS